MLLMKRIANRRERRQLEQEGMLPGGNMYKLGDNGEWCHVDSASLPRIWGRYPAQLYYVSPVEFDVPMRVVISHPDTPNPVVLSMYVTVALFLAQGGTGLLSMMRQRRLNDYVTAEHVSQYLEQDYQPRLRSALESMVDEMPAGRTALKSFLENLGDDDRRKLMPRWLVLKSLSVSVDYELTDDQKCQAARAAEQRILQQRQQELKLSAMALSLGQAGTANMQRQQESEERIRQSIMREMEHRQIATVDNSGARGVSASCEEMPQHALLGILRRRCGDGAGCDVTAAMADGRLAVRLGHGGYVTVLCVGDDGQLRLLVPNAADRVSFWEKGECEVPVFSGCDAPKGPSSAGIREAYVVLSDAPLITADRISTTVAAGGHIVTAAENAQWGERMEKWNSGDWAVVRVSTAETGDK